MAKKSLASILKLQLWLHTSVTSLFFIALTFFFLFSLEDYFHEQQLITISNIVAVNGSVKNLPAHIKIYTNQEVPAAWVALLKQEALNTTIEIYTQNGEVIHALHSQFNDSKKSFILVLETSKTGSIWSMSDKILVLILPWILIFLVGASFLATKFIGRIQDQFTLLLTTINKNESPAALTQFIQKQPIAEISEFGQLFNQVWQQKIEILSREKQGLEYLSHELRTPIQSSLATLELLALKTEDKKIIERLSRSLNRMKRLSNSILCLMESEQHLPTYPIDTVKVCMLLVDELKPLADVKKQSICLNIISATTHDNNPLQEDNLTLEENTTQKDPVKFIATQELIETILSILLTNALQHSGSSPINITINDECVCITNQKKENPILEYSTNKNEQGYGIGLTIAQRLADKFNLKLDVIFSEENQVTATISNKKRISD